MRKLTLALLAALPMMAQAGGDFQSDAEYCKEVAKIAEAVMDLRQMGEPMRKVLMGSDNLTFRRIVMMAYDVGTVPDREGLRQYAVTEFGNVIHSKCLRGE